MNDRILVNKRVDAHTYIPNDKYFCIFVSFMLYLGIYNCKIFKNVRFNKVCCIIKCNTITQFIIILPDARSKILLTNRQEIYDLIFMNAFHYDTFPIFTLPKLINYITLHVTVISFNFSKAMQLQ